MRDNIKMGSRRLQEWLLIPHEEEKRVNSDSVGSKLKWPNQNWKTEIKHREEGL